MITKITQLHRQEFLYHLKGSIVNDYNYTEKMANKIIELSPLIDTWDEIVRDNDVDLAIYYWHFDIEDWARDVIKYYKLLMKGESGCAEPKNLTSKELGEAVLRGMIEGLSEKQEK